MPFALSALIARNVRRFPSRSPASSADQQELYFSPGGHTHDRHTIPPDRLRISLSDPVLLAAEQYLSNLPDDYRRGKDDGARKTPKIGSLAYLNGGILSQWSGDDSIDALQPVNPLPMAQATSAPHRKTGFQGPATHGSMDPSDDSNEISEVVTISSAIDGFADGTDSSASVNSQFGSDLAPLASETFRQELYIRGYLKRPASQPSNVASRKSRISFMFGSRNIFPKFLGRRQGPKVAERLRAEQDAAETPSGLDAHLSEEQPSTSVGCITLRTPQADSLESPWMNTNSPAAEIPGGLDPCPFEEQPSTPVGCKPPQANDLESPWLVSAAIAHLFEEQPPTPVGCVTLRTPQADGLESPSVDTPTSASESLDLHEFSYLTAFTTPPASPSTVLYAETFKKGVDLGDSKRAV